MNNGHQVGDIHPKHSNWIWTEYERGKFDWRIMKNEYSFEEYQDKWKNWQIDKVKRSLPNYVSAPDTMHTLYNNMLQFIKGNDSQRLMIVAGDTFIGKSFLLRKILDELYIVRHRDLPERLSGLQYDEHAFDYGCFEVVDGSISTARDFQSIIEKHHGEYTNFQGEHFDRLFVFDNAEKYLMQKKYLSVWHDALKMSQGRFIVIMNKRLKDFTQGRLWLKELLDQYGISYDIRFTIGEQMDLLKTIWNDITISGEEKYGTQEEVYTMHEEAYNFMYANIQRINPRNAVVAVYRDILHCIYASKRRKSFDSALMRELCGKPISWQDEALQILTK